MPSRSIQVLMGMLARRSRFVVRLFVIALCANAYAGEATKLPRPEHIVIVIEKGCGFSRLIGNAAAPYTNALARRGALFSQSYAIAAASQPNHLALFSGSTQGVADDSCPHTFSGHNLANRLIHSGYTFEIYSEALPAVGYSGCVYGNYHRARNPAVNWQGVNVPADINMPLSRLPSNFALLPTITFVVPDSQHDMRGGSQEAIARGDAWLRQHIDGYVRWARTHRSLLVITSDTSAGSEDWRIPTLFVGPMVRPGNYSQRIDHYSVLATVLTMYGVERLGESAGARVIDNIWMRGAAQPRSSGADEQQLRGVAAAGSALVSGM